MHVHIMMQIPVSSIDTRSYQCHPCA